MANWSTDELGIYQNTKIEKLSYPEEGNDTWFSLEERSPWFNQRNDLILAMLEKHPAEGDFLDIGGGNGFQAKAIINAGFKGQVILCEPGLQGCINARKRNIPLVYNGIFQDFPFDKYNVKVCGLFDVVEHIEDDVKFLNELYDSIQIGTKVFINVPAMKVLWSQMDEFSGHFRRYDNSDIERLKQQTKFKFVDHGYYFSFYFLPLLLLRAIPYKLGIRKSLEKIMQSETGNHSSGKGIISSYVAAHHKKWISNVKQNKYPSYGTSMFMVLEK